jgi:hypothetical protein
MSDLQCYIRRNVEIIYIFFLKSGMYLDQALQNYKELAQQESSIHIHSQIHPLPRKD